MRWGRGNHDEELARAADAVEEVASRPFGIDELQEACTRVMELGEAASQAARDQAIAHLVPLVEEGPILASALVALACGALVEQDGDEFLALDATLTRCGEALRDGAAFAAACHARGEANAQAVAGANIPGTSGQDEDEDEERDDIEMYGLEVAEEMPAGAMAWDALEILYLPAVAMMSRSPEARAEARGRGDFTRGLETFMETSPIESGAAQWLAQMAQVLDDQEVLVLHPEQRKGFRLVMGGISDNFQLHTLLARLLIGNPSNGWLPGTVPPPGQGVWNLVNWTGLRPDKTLDGAEAGASDFRDSSEHWIWGEGVPGDIALFEDRLVVLLDKPPYSRSWNPDQMFSGMKPSLEVLEVLSAAQVDQWLSRLARAASQLAEEDAETGGS